MEFPLKTGRERIIAALLLFLWALLFLPHLRTNPNWYGDEGFWMESSWTFIHGHPRNGAISLDFLFPYPYPPLYLLLNGAALRLFGNDIVVGRALQALTALAAGAILFWIGTRLRSKSFGFLCAAAFLAYPEVVINFRWVRSHPLAGTLALASVGFLVRYVQQKRLRDLVWAGVVCSLATATSYWTYGLIVAVVATALLVNWRHAAWAAGSAAAYIGLFFLFYVISHPDGLVQWFKHMELLTFMSSLEGKPASSWFGEVVRLVRTVYRFCFLTPTSFPGGARGVDVWLIVATLGMVALPSPRVRRWAWFWLLALMYAVFKGTNNASTYLYRAMIFVPFMAIGMAAAVGWLGLASARWVTPRRRAVLQLLPGALMLGVFGIISLAGSFGHFRTKIDSLTVQSRIDSEAVAAFLDEHSTKQDFVIVPSQLYWLVQNTRKSQLVDCLAFEGQPTGVWPAGIPRELFWFDCRWQDAKYLVLAAGTDANGQAYGVDAAFTLHFAAVREVLAAVRAGHWPVVFERGEYVVLGNPKFA